MKISMKIMKTSMQKHGSFSEGAFSRILKQCDHTDVQCWKMLVWNGISAIPEGCVDSDFLIFS